MNKKLVFIGDTNSINIELINKSHNFLKNKVKYILIGNKKEVTNYLRKISSKVSINEIYDPLNLENYDKNKLNIFNVENISSEKSTNLINQIKISNYLSEKTKFDLVTLPINKSIFKKKIEFNGMTEFLGEINNKKTIMLMYGDKFSIIPFTTHINLKYVTKYIKKNLINNFIKNILKQIKNQKYNLQFDRIKFLCVNPHCSENKTLGIEDSIISDVISNFNFIEGPLAADSAFLNIKQKTLYLSAYHDQALIPFKIINKKSFNLTLGLNYRRLSPAHGTASNIIFQNIADNNSYLECMKF